MPMGKPTFSMDSPKNSTIPLDARAAPTEGRRLRILLSCYSCGPDRGSEPGVGWNAALAMAEFHEVHVLTTSEFQEKIQSLIEAGEIPTGLQFHFYELPLGRWWWRHGRLHGIRIHYYWWQIFAGFAVKALHKRLQFDSAQHLTFVCYWAPSCLAFSKIPYILGPVGGAEFTPKPLYSNYTASAKFKETLRAIVRWTGEHDPFVIFTHRNAKRVLATTRITAERCQTVAGASANVEVCGESALSTLEFQQLSAIKQTSELLVFACMGRLIYWKGYDLAIKAFDRAKIPGATLLIIGGGPEYFRLNRLAKSLGVASEVLFTGPIQRQKVLDEMSRVHVLIHPSHHDSGGWACIEAMAAGKPVVCLDWGGPATQVAPDAGFRITIGDEDSVVQGLADAMCRLSDETLRHAKGEAAKHHVRENYLWPAKAAYYSDLHRRIVNGGSTHAQ